jgi:hypothetical protein
MNSIGPPLETLVRRLIDTPPDFLDEPRIGNTGRVHVAAVVNDLLARRGGRARDAALSAFESGDARADRNRLALVLVLAWLLDDDAFAALRITTAALLETIDPVARELAAATPANRFVTDPERREELVRMVLARLDLRPEGETPAQAADRLSSLSGSERRRLLEASREAEKRARAVREALARKAAEESADKWTRE